MLRPQFHEESPKIEVPPTPIVYVSDPLRWVYQQIIRDDAVFPEDELNALGAESWELTAVCASGSGQFVFYFKRLEP